MIYIMSFQLLQILFFKGQMESKISEANGQQSFSVGVNIFSWHFHPIKIQLFIEV